LRGGFLGLFKGSSKRDPQIHGTSFGFVSPLRETTLKLYHFARLFPAFTGRRTLQPWTEHAIESS
jgi:hypothetical protein